MSMSERDSYADEYCERAQWEKGYSKGFADAKKKYSERPHGEWMQVTAVTNAEEAKEYPIITKKDADNIAEAFKRLHCKYRTENSECDKTNDDCFPDSIPFSCPLKRGEAE